MDFQASHSCHYDFFQLIRVANSKEKHWGQIMGGTKATIDDLKAAVKANMTVTIDMTANDKDRVGVDVIWNQESVDEPRQPRHYVGI